MFRNYFRSFASLALALAMTFAVVGPALAAPPANDTFPGATLANIGFSEVLDTSEATTDADDAQLTCHTPPTDAASVWYAIEGSGSWVVVDVSQSNYSAAVLVGIGTQGNLQLVNCGAGNVYFHAEAGTTYYILVIDYQGDGGGNGGLLSISFNEAPPPPAVDLTVNRFGTINAQTGVATISGTYTCTNADVIIIGVDARQNVGRFAILGSADFFDVWTCDGTVHTWSMDIFPQNGKFAGGKMLTVIHAAAGSAFGFDTEHVEQTVQLRGDR